MRGTSDECVVVVVISEDTHRTAYEFRVNWVACGLIDAVTR
jgi:hypothetical protein